MGSAAKIARDATWCVYNDGDRAIGIVRLGGSIAEASRGRSSSTLSAPIQAIQGARRGRFLIQEGKHRLRMFSASTDSLSAAIEAPTVIQSIHRATDETFLVALETGVVHMLTIDNDGIRLDPQPLLKVGGEILGTLPSRELLVTTVSGRNEPSTWNIYSTRTGYHLATIPRLDVNPEIRGDELWAKEAPQGRDLGKRHREMRIPLELLELGPEVIAADITHRYGLDFDHSRVAKQRGKALSIVPVPEIYIVD